MLSELNSFLVNEVVNGVLLLIVVVIYVNTIIDRRLRGSKQDRDFSLFVLFSGIYLGLMLAGLPLAHFGSNALADFAVSTLRVLAAVATYAFFASWIISIAEEKGLAQPILRHFVIAAMAALFLLSVILRVATGSTLIANVPIFLYYLLLTLLAIWYQRALGSVYTLMLVTFIVIELLLQVQDWWVYTPANVFLVLGEMTMYSRGWIGLKQQRINDERIIAEQRADLENARTKLVLSQIKPHFLFNTPSTIAHLCTKEPELARDLCFDLSTYLRGNLSALDSGRTVPFATELEHVKTYLKIEQTRFGDKLALAYDIRDVDFDLPVLTVEPLAENAVKHGIRKNSKGGTVLIATRKDPDCHVVVVQDDGAGFDVASFDENEGDHIGIRSVRRRVELLSNGTLTIESRPGVGTIATLCIPKAADGFDGSKTPVRGDQDIIE